MNPINFSDPFLMEVYFIANELFLWLALAKKSLAASYLGSSHYCFDSGYVNDKVFSCIKIRKIYISRFVSMMIYRKSYDTRWRENRSRPL